MKKLLTIILLTFGWAIAASAQEVNFSATVITNTGRPVAGATVAFCAHNVSAPNPCTTYVTIYSDVEGLHPIANPTKTDGYGNAFFFAPAGTYDYSVSGIGIRTQTFKGATLSVGGAGGTNYQTVQENGAAQTQRPSLNLVDGSNTTVVCVDDPGTSSTNCQVNAPNVSGAGLATDNTFTNNNRFKGPIPFRDATAFGARQGFYVFGATTTNGSPNVTINAAGDLVNGEYVSIIGAGQTATVLPPDLTPIAITSVSRDGAGTSTATIAGLGNTLCANCFQWLNITGVTDSSFDGIFESTGGGDSTHVPYQVNSGGVASSSGGFINPGIAVYEGTNPGSTTHAYTVCTMDAFGGCSAKSAALTITNDPATLTQLDHNWIYLGHPTPTGGDGFCIYDNGTFKARTWEPAYEDDGTVMPRNENCPATEPSSATNQTLTAKVLSGAGTTSIVLDTNAGAAVSGATLFHDAAPAINAALAAGVADGLASTEGGPDVILPFGQYYISRVKIDHYKLITNGSLILTTHPIIIGNDATFEGHGQTEADAVGYNTDRARIVSGNVEGFILRGSSSGNSTIRGATFLATSTTDITLAADVASGPSNVTIENVGGYHTTAGQCLLDEGDTIFLNVDNWSCVTASTGRGASVNRYAFYFSNQFMSGGGDWDIVHWKHGLIVGAPFYMDSPAPLHAAGNDAIMKFADFTNIDIESNTSKGYFTIDAGCQSQTPPINVSAAFNVFTNITPSDELATLEGVWYLPRVGSTGCATANISSVGSNTYVGAQAVAELGTDLGTANAANSGSVILDPQLLSADAQLIQGQSRVGGRGVVSGGALWMDLDSQGTAAAAGGRLIPPPQFTIQDGGAGGSCGAGLTKYFVLSAADGFGGFSKPYAEHSATTGAGGEYIQLVYGTTLSSSIISPAYRVWVGTTSGGENSYYDTSNTGSFNYGCGAPTGSGTPPTYGTAYFWQVPAQSGTTGRYGLSSTDFFGIGKTPGYTLDSAGLINTDKGLLMTEGAAASGVSSKSVIYSKAVTHWLYMKNASNADSGEVTIPGITGAVVGGDCVQFVDAFTIQDNGSACGSGGTGTVTSVGVATVTTGTQNMFTTNTANPNTTPVTTLTLVNAPAHTVFGNTSGSAGAPDYVSLTAAMEPSTTVNSVVNDTNVTGSISTQALTLGWTGTLGVARGGTSESSFTKGDTLCPSASTTMTKLAVGSNGKVLTANSAAGCGIDWETPATGLTLDTNTVANSSQVLLNFTNTSGASGINFTNPSGGVESATLASVAGGGNATLQGTLTGPTAGDQICENGSTILVNCTPGVAPNAQTGTTYTILTGDRGKIITTSNASAIAVTLPQAGTAGFGSNFFFSIRNIGAGAVTITPTTSTINGNATLVLLKGMQASIVSDNTNYIATVSGYATGTTGTITGTALTSTCDSGTVTINGAAAGMPVSVSSTTGADVGGAFDLRASVTSSNTITVYVCGTGTPANLAYNVSVFPLFQ